MRFGSQVRLSPACSWLRSRVSRGARRLIRLTLAAPPLVVLTAAAAACRRHRMEDWGGALEVDGLPSSASIDELSVLLSELANCRQHHILLSSRGASSVGTCLVLLPSAGTAAAVADLLDSYPLSGGLLEARPCADPAAWVQRHVMQVGAGWVASAQPLIICAFLLNGQLFGILPARSTRPMWFSCSHCRCSTCPTSAAAACRPACPRRRRCNECSRLLCSCLLCSCHPRSRCRCSHSRRQAAPAG